MAGYLSVRKLNPQTPRQCFSTWSPEATGQWGTVRSRPGDPDLMQFNALNLSHKKELIVHKSSSGKHPNLEVGISQREVQEESRNLQQQKSSGRSRKTCASASKCTTALPGGPKTKKIGRHDLLPARGMRGEGIKWRCNQNTNKR